ncbi:MAG: formylmethanofuran dehydrogenase subunit C [Planctomycetota bacterium]
MNSLRLEWKNEAPPGWIHAGCLLPETLCPVPLSDIARRRISCGRTRYELGDLFQIIEIGSSARPYLTVEGHRRFVSLGGRMTEGVLEVEGSAGSLLGVGMSGGEISVSGDAGTSTGAGMTGGLISVDGDVGDEAGGPAPGETRGMSGGEIVVRGDAGAGAGFALRRGLVAIAGKAGPGCANSLLAGTIVIGRGSLSESARGVQRGTIVLLDPSAEVPEGFGADSESNPVFWRVLHRRLEELDFPIERPSLDAQFRS